LHRFYSRDDSNSLSDKHSGIRLVDGVRGRDSIDTYWVLDSCSVITILKSL
jgi:hypothetical protein